MAAFGLSADPVRQPTVIGPDRVWSDHIFATGEVARWVASKRSAGAWEGLKVIHPNAAGLDIGSEEIWAAVAPERTR